LLFQLKLLLYFIQRGIENKHSFQIATELSKGEKFDDLIFAWKEPERKDISITFLQAKHKQLSDGLHSKIKPSDLLSNDESAPFQVRAMNIGQSTVG